MTVAVIVDQKNPTMKTGEEHTMKSIKCLSLITTTLFMLAPSIMLVTGIVVHCNYYNFEYFISGANNAYYVTPSVLFIFLGAALIFVSVIGLTGTLTNSTCMVNCYALMLILLFVVKLVVVIMAFTMDAESILEYVYFPVNQYTTNPEVQGEIDMVQRQSGCCGAYSYTEYVDVQFTSNHSTLLTSRIVNGNMTTLEVPRSCCSNENMNYCVGLYMIGCKQSIVDALGHNATVLGTLGVTFMIINFLGIIFSLLLARYIRKIKSQKALQAWKIKEQMIMARRVEEQVKAEHNHVYIEQQATSAA